MEQVWKKARLFTQLSALFEDLVDNPKSSTLWATELRRVLKRFTTYKTAALGNRSKLRRVFKSWQNQTKDQLNNKEEGDGFSARKGSLLFSRLLPKSQLRWLKLYEEESRRKSQLQ